MRTNLRRGGRFLWLGHMGPRLGAAWDSRMSVPWPWARSKRALPLPFLAQNAVALWDTRGARRAGRGLSTTNALATHSATRGTQGRALRRKACRGGWGSPPRGREGRGARALSLRGPTASARALRYPTQHPASGSCSSATEAALLASGSSANALRFP